MNNLITITFNIQNKYQSRLRIHGGMTKEKMNKRHNRHDFNSDSGEGWNPAAIEPKQAHFTHANSQE